MSADEITEPVALIHSMQNGTSWGSDQCYKHILGAHVLGHWSTIMGKTERKWCVTKQKETEKQFTEAWLQKGTLDRHEI